MAPVLLRGSIVWAMIPGSRGEAPQDHPCIVMNSQAWIDAGNDLQVVGISTTIPDRPLPPHVFDVPSQPGGHPQTQLEEACVAFADWMPTLPQREIRRIGGRAPANLVKQIANWQKDCFAKLKKRSTDDHSSE